jgi:hypothetical protein
MKYSRFVFANVKRESPHLGREHGNIEIVPGVDCLAVVAVTCSSTFVRGNMVMGDYNLIRQHSPVPPPPDPIGMGLSHVQQNC